MYYIYLIYRGKQRQSRRPLNNIIVKNLSFNLCLMFDLLAIIYKCFLFRVLIACVQASVHSDPFLLYSEIFVLSSLPIKQQ